MSLNDVFGEVKKETAKTHWFKFTEENPTLVLRILPPFKSQKSTGKWSKYYMIHFGYKDTKGKLRPFESCEVVNRETKMIEVQDAATDRIKALRMKQEEAKLKGDTEMVKRIGEQLRIFNVKKSHYMNVMDLNGKIGVLSIPHKMKMDLDAEIKKLEQKGINPIGVTGGRYFVFTRTGTGSNTVHKVSVYEEEVTMNGMKVKIEKSSDLTEEIARRMVVEGTDLGGLYIRPTSQEISEIVKANGGAVLEAVFKKYSTKSTSVVDEEHYEEEASTATQTSSSNSNSAKEVSTPVVNTSQVAATTIATPVTAPATTEQSAEDFLKSMGL